MNQTLWQQHLADRNADLRAEIHRLRVLLTFQRRRADMWKQRAINAKKKPRK